MTGVQSQVRVVSVRVHKPAVRLHVLCNSLLVFLAMGCIVALCLGGQYFVKTYRKTHVFEETTCKTTGVTWVDRYAKCCTSGGSIDVCDEPGAGVAGFPCLHITASFDNSGKNHSAKVYKDDETWGTMPKCSYPLCDSYQFYGDQPNAEASAFAEKYQVGSVYSCYLSLDSHEVIIDLSVTRMQVFHSMFWPSLALVICIVALVVLRKHRLSNESADEPPFTRF